MGGLRALNLKDTRPASTRMAAKPWRQKGTLRLLSFGGLFVQNLAGALDIVGFVSTAGGSSLVASAPVEIVWMSTYTPTLVFLLARYLGGDQAFQHIRQAIKSIYQGSVFNRQGVNLAGSGAQRYQ